MPIERLLQPRINAKDFQPVEERPRSAIQRFDALKNSPLYDKKNDQWRNVINGTADNSYISGIQLMGVIAEEMFNQEKALHQYMKLKSIQHYHYDFLDKQPKFWYSNQGSGSYISTEDQLLGILTESKFDITEAQQNYSHLKKTRFYNPDQKTWRSKLNRAQTDWIYEPKEQFLGTFVEASFDTQQAEEKYTQLKKSNLYGLNSLLDRCTDTAIVALFNKNKARKQYKEIVESTQDMEMLYTRFELWKIIIEKMIEDKEPNFTKKQIPVPEIRVF